MIVIGSDPHMRGYSFAAVDAETGELRSSETVKATTAGHEQMLTRHGRLPATGYGRSKTAPRT
jgi:hypothetical protein